MRITIDSDELGQLKTGLPEGTPAGAAIDAGPAPIEHIRKMSGALAGPEGVDLASSTASHDPYEKLPLNLLRAGSAAARQRPQSVEDQPMATTDGGPAALAAQDKAPAAAANAALLAKRRKAGAKRRKT